MNGQHNKKEGILFRHLPIKGERQGLCRETRTWQVLPLRLRLTSFLPAPTLYE